MRKVSCPRCGKEVEWEGNLLRPFCSQGCQERDLGEWASERYRIKGEPEGTESLPPRGKSEE